MITLDATTVRLLVADRSAISESAARAPLTDWLSDSEKDRLARIKAPVRREEFIACRYALRWLLADLEHASIAQWSLEAPEGQAPRLGAKHALPEWHLSLSHSHGLIACAVALQPVGIDIEVLTRRLASPIHDLAALVSTPAQRGELEAINDPVARQQRFLLWWSLKEAWFKRAGTGVDFQLISKLECPPAVKNDAPISGQSHARAWMADVDHRPAYVLSVCTDHPVAQYHLSDPSPRQWREAGDYAMLINAAVDA